MKTLSEDVPKDPVDLILIDGPAVVYRAHYAVAREPLRTSSGEDVGATYISTRIIWNLLKEKKPRFAIAVWDRGLSQREKIQATYKQHRPPTPKPIVRQRPYIQAIWEALGIVHAAVEGYEADDLIATLVDQAKNQGMRILIVTSDKDLFQLVDHHMALWDPSTRPATLYTEEDVREKFGIPPRRLAEYLALVGDAADNIPGIPGIGPKTAREILQTIHLDKLPEGLDLLPRKYQKLLRSHIDQVIENLSMFRLKTVPVTLKDFLKECRENRTQLRQWFQKLEFFKLLEEVAQPLQPCPPASSLFPPSHGGVVATTHGFIVANGQGCFEVKNLPNGGSWVAFDAKDLFLRGVSSVEGDLSLGAYLLNPDLGRYTPSDIGLAYAGTLVPDDPHAVAWFTWTLFPKIQKNLQEEGLWDLLQDIEIPVARVLADMERRGIPIQRERLEKVRKDLIDRLYTLEREIFQLAGEPFNLRSPQQLSHILFEKIGLKPVKKTRKGSFSTDASVLEKLSHIHPLPAKILEYREVEKIRSSYLDNLFQYIHPETGRMHPIFDQKTAATGRIVTKNPNLQTLPVRGAWAVGVREAFQTRDGFVFLSADYSQIELRILAHLSGDESLLQAFQHGEDIHARTAAMIFGKDPQRITSEERRMAKVVNFGIIYGIQAWGLSESLGISVEEAQTLIERTLAGYPGVVAWMERVEGEALERGEVRTLLERRRRVPLRKDLSHNEYEALRRIAVNTPVQGSAADIIKLAMIRITQAAQEKGLEGGLVLQIHDELIFEIPETQRDTWQSLVREGMEGALSLRVPLSVSFHTGKTLADLLK